MKLTCWAVCLASMGGIAPIAAAAECGELLPAHGRQQVAARGFTLIFVPSVWPIPVGKHFNLSLQICAETGQTISSALKVDADMPMHKHGMNYRASVSHLGEGNYSANGLMFHMPGRWRFLFEIGGEQQSTRLSQEIDVP
jgi:YtkA-like